MFRAFILPVLLAGSAAVSSPLAAATLATTTTLTVSPPGSGAEQNLVTLTASVSDANGPVLHGAVTFYNFGEALGTAQLISTGSGGFTPGTAVLRMRFVNDGKNYVIANFNGTSSEASSQSLPQEFEPAGSNGGYPTTTSLVYNGVANGMYSLTANVLAANPSGESNETGYSLGTITFTDTTTSTVLRTSNAMVPNSPDSSLLTTGTPVPGLCTQLIAAGDFNNDGYPDAVTASPSSDGSCTAGDGVLTALLNSGNGTFTTATGSMGLVNPNGLAAGDFNADGNLDVAVIQAAGTVPQVLVFLGNGDGTFQAPVGITLSAGFQPEALAVGDFNNDGILDLALASVSAPTHTGTVMILPGNGNGTFGMPVETKFRYYFATQSSQDAVPWVSMAVGYLNGDGNADLVITLGVTVGAFAGNGDGTFQAPVALVVGASKASNGVTYAQAATSVSIFQDRGNPIWGGKNGAELYVACRGDSPPAPLSAMPPQVVLFTFSNTAGEPFSFFRPDYYMTTLPTASGLVAPIPTSIAAADQNAVMTYGGAAQLISFADGYVSVGATPGYAGSQIAEADFRGNGETGFLVAAESGVALVEPAIPAAATLTLSSWPGWGTQLVTATFTSAAEGGLLSSTSNTATVDLSEVTLTSNMPASMTAIAGQAVQITATLAGAANGIAPTGSIQFYDSGVATGAVVPVASGAAVYSSTAFAAGTHSITAIYSGDSNYASETSAALAFKVVSKGTVTLIISGAPSSAGLGASFAVTPRWIETPVVLGPNPSGMVTLNDNGQAVASNYTTRTMTVNTAASPLPGGANSLTMSYPGDSNWAAASSPAVTVTVTPAVTVTTLGASAQSAGFGTNLTFTAAIAGEVGTLIPSGAVQFYDGTTALGNPVVLADGTAAFSTAALAAGAHSITADYTGDTNYAGSTSAPVTESIMALVVESQSSRVTVSSGGTAMVTLAVDGADAADAITSFACSGLPKKATCNFDPQTVTGSGQTKLTITTKTRNAAARAIAQEGLLAVCAVWLLWPMGLCVRRLCCLLLLAAGLGMVQGCGGQLEAFSTPPGTYAVTLTATTVSGDVTFTQSAKVYLLVELPGAVATATRESAQP
jgi:hypothetical protein